LLPETIKVNDLSEDLKDLFGCLKEEFASNEEFDSSRMVLLVNSFYLLEVDLRAKELHEVLKGSQTSFVKLLYYFILLVFLSTSKDEFLYCFDVFKEVDGPFITHSLFVLPREDVSILDVVCIKRGVCPVLHL
jgi:hypothetical protein